MSIRKTRRSDTKHRIIMSSQVLFSKYGYKNTTLRKVTRLASSNLASVNYHFNSKEGLFKHIIISIFSDLLHTYKNNYNKKIQRGNISIKSLLEIFVDSLLDLNSSNSKSCMLLYRLYECSHDKKFKINEFLSPYNDEFLQIRKEIQNTLNLLNEDEFNTRITFILNSIIPLLVLIESKNKAFTQNKVVNYDDVYKFIPIICTGIEQKSN